MCVFLGDFTDFTMVIHDEKPSFGEYFQYFPTTEDANLSLRISLMQILIELNSFLSL